jgi:replication factor C subunit 3/5
MSKLRKNIKIPISKNPIKKTNTVDILEKCMNDFKIYKNDFDLTEINKEKDDEIQNNNHLLWVEKYRPKKLDDIVSNDSIKASLKKYLKQNFLPHLLFYGPSGIGKTSIINAFANELYGDKVSLMVLQINASEERGIEIVRNKIKNFVISKCILKEFHYKLVILDEADSMTLTAQSMLRRIIEDFTFNARFCLICNKIKNIDPAIQSRCTIFKFSQLSNVDIKKAITNICDLNKIKYTPTGIDYLIKISKGDLRKIINNIQSIALAYDTLSYDDISTCLGYPNIKDIITIYTTTKKNNLMTSEKILKDLIEKNQYSLIDIIIELHEYLLQEFLNGKIEENIFSNTILKLKKIEQNIYVCPSNEIAISSLISCFY